MSRAELIFTLVMGVGAPIGIAVWATRAGSPQHVWFFCQVLGLC